MSNPLVRWKKRHGAKALAVGALLGSAAASIALFSASSANYTTAETQEKAGLEALAAANSTTFGKIIQLPNPNDLDHDGLFNLGQDVNLPELERQLQDPTKIKLDHLRNDLKEASVSDIADNLAVYEGFLKSPEYHTSLAQTFDKLQSAQTNLKAADEPRVWSDAQVAAGTAVPALALIGVGAVAFVRRANRNAPPINTYEPMATGQKPS